MLQESILKFYSVPSVLDYELNFVKYFEMRY